MYLNRKHWNYFILPFPMIIIDSTVIYLCLMLKSMKMIKHSYLQFICWILKIMKTSNYFVKHYSITSWYTPLNCSRLDNHRKNLFLTFIFRYYNKHLKNSKSLISTIFPSFITYFGRTSAFWRLKIQKHYLMHQTHEKQHKSFYDITNQKYLSL